MKRTHLLVIFAVSWLLGMGFSAAYAPVLTWPILIFAVGVGAYATWKLDGWMKIVPMLLLGFVLGIVRANGYFLDQRWYDVSDLIGRHVVVTGTVIDDPGWNDQRLFEFYLADLRVDGRATPGLLKVKSQIGNVLEGQRVEVSGKVGQALGRAPAQIWYAKVVITDPRQAYPIRLKHQLNRGLSTALSREQSGFMQGLLFGSRAGISAETATDLRVDGLTHIVAVSGYNLTIIVGSLAIFMRRKSLLTLTLSVFAIGVYVMMTGFSSSILRAAVMSVLLLVCSYSRRKVDLWAVLAVTIVAMTVWSPAYVLSDISWQLSVLALVGVLGVAPQVVALQEYGIRSWKRAALDVLLVSVAAHLVTAPIIAYYFGTFSLIAPMTNLVVLPAIPFLMLGGIFAATVGLMAPGVAYAMMLPLRVSIDIVLHVASWFARVPHAEIAIGEMSEFGMIVAYGMLIILAILLQLKSRHIRLKNV